MAVNYLNGINLNQTALISALMNPIAGDPASPVEGEVWYNSITETLRYRDSTQNVTLASGSGIGSLVEDTTPQLGGMLDVNGNTIGDGTRELLSFVEDALAVNQLEVENEATGSGPILRSTGDDVNVSMNLQTKGSGVVNIEADLTITGTVDGRDVATDGAKLDGITGTNTGDEVQATETVSGIAEIATQAEADAGAIDTHMVTPAKLAALDPTAMGWFIDEDSMATDSAVRVPSQQSVKAYVDSSTTSAMTHKGGYDAATDTPALDTGTPSIEIGDTYTVTVAGNFFGVAVEVGDRLIADVTSVDAAALSDWTIVQTNLDQATETVAGFAEIATQAEVDAGTDDTRIVTPLKLATYSGLLGKYTELIGNGAATQITVTHNLGTKALAWAIREVATDEAVMADVIFVTTNTTRFDFAVAPAASAYEITLIG